MENGKEYTVGERSKILRRIGDLILERQEELARLESLDTGKAILVGQQYRYPASSL